MSDIVLVYPKTGMDLMPTIAPPHSVLSIAAEPVKAGYSVKIIDERVDKNWEQTVKDEVNKKPLYVGISTMTGTQVKFALKTAKIVRETNDDVPIVFGGYHPKLMPRQTLENEYVDVVCSCDGEYVTKELADCFGNHKPLWMVNGIMWKSGGKIIENESRKRTDVNKVDYPHWELVDINNYIHPDLYLNKIQRVLDIGQTSRGCPFHCAFCCIGGCGYTWMAMDAEKAIEWIRKSVTDYKLNGIWLRDDEFYINQDRAAEICLGMIPLKIKWYSSGTRIDIFNKTSEENLKIYQNSGAGIFKFGAESGNDRVLQMLGKGFTVDDIIKANLKAKRLGIIPAYNLMAGIPTQTINEIDDTINMMVRMKHDNPNARFETIMTYAPMPGTKLWDVSLEYGLKPPTKLEDWINWRFDEYDIDGSRSPWYSDKERQIIGNICYLGSLAHVVPNMINSYGNRNIGKIMKMAYWLPRIYFKWRFENKKYTHVPELEMVKFVREKVFYGR